MNKIIETIKTFDEKNRPAAVNRIIEAMNADADANENWNSGKDLCECFGFDGAALSPITRTSFVRVYGETVTAALEYDAKAQIAEMAQIVTGGRYADHKRAAAENMKKPATAWSVGDFVTALDCGLKFDHQSLAVHLADISDFEKEDAERSREDYRNVRPRLCRIVRIEERPADYFTRDGLKDWTPQGSEGGSASDDVPDGCHYLDCEKQLRDAYLATFYSLCVLVRNAEGDYVLIDPEGYDYPRYLLAPTDYRVMFAPIVEAELARRERVRVEKEEAERAETEKARAAYDARCAKWAAIMKPLPKKDWREDERIRKTNVLAMAKAAFPGAYFTLRKPSGWGDGYKLSWTNGPTEDEVKEATDFGLFTDRWDEFDSMTDYAYTSKARFTDFSQKYGAIKNNVEFCRTEAPTDRNRKPRPKRSSEPSAVAVGGASVTENAERNGIEIRFASKPPQDVIDRIKARRCWRWSRFSGCWYTRANEDERRFAHELVETLAG